MELTLSTGRKIGDGHPAFMAAEVGQNHQGDPYTAVRLMKACADAGVDAVKLCKRDIASELTPAAFNAPYTGPNSFGATYGEHRLALELDADAYRHLAERVRYNEWPFSLFATACDLPSLQIVEQTLHPPLFKIASRDLDNLPLVEAVAAFGRPVVLSAGMAGPGEIEAAIDAVRKYHDYIILCVCTSEYPTPNHHVGLRRIKIYRDRYNVLVGLSDHTTGITAAIAGAALGAAYIEKHVTLSRAMKGTDHAASLEPEGIRRLVAKVREVEEMMQPYEERPTRARLKLGRSIVAVRDLPAGTMLCESDITLASPGTGLRWSQRATVIGRETKRDYRKGMMIQ